MQRPINSWPGAHKQDMVQQDLPINDDNNKNNNELLFRNDKYMCAWQIMNFALWPCYF